MTSLGQPAEPAAIGVFEIGAKQTAPTPVGRGPAVMYSLWWIGTLPFEMLSLSWLKATTPSPGVRGSPVPPQRVALSVEPNGMHGLLHVKPPFDVRLTKTPFVSFRRSKWISA